MTFNLLQFATMIVAGFTSCTEFGSYAFVHPVIRNLPPEHHVEVEKGLLKTFGRVMPVLMTLCPILSVSYAIQGTTASSVSTIRWCSALGFLTALISTVIFNVPLNLATGRWHTPGASFKLETGTRSMGVLSRSAFLVAIDRIHSALPYSGHPYLTPPSNVFQYSLGC